VPLPGRSATARHHVLPACGAPLPPAATACVRYTAPQDGVNEVAPPPCRPAWRCGGVLILVVARPMDTLGSSASKPHSWLPP